MVVVSLVAARAALQGYKRQHHAVEPDNEDQLKVYIEMREKFQRVSGGQFLKYLETGKQEVKAGNQSVLSYWAVPKANFPNGLPKKIALAESSDGVADAEGIDQVDRDQFYVIDQCVPRDQLGKNVWVVSTYSGAQSKYLQSGPSKMVGARLGAVDGALAPATGGVDAAAAGALADNRQAGSQGSQAAALALPPGGQPRALRERPSDAFKDHGDEEREDPEARQARILKDTLVTLRKNIEDAKKANVWVSIANFTSSENLVHS